MKVYVTKYALTQGIWAVEAERVSGKTQHIRTTGYPTFYYEGEWALNREFALKQAEEMRRKKIESLRKQITKLENLKIEVHE